MQMQTAIVSLASIRQAFAAINLKVMGNTQCQHTWATVCAQCGPTSEALENFFDVAREQRIPVPPPMFKAKHELERIEAADEKTARHFELHKDGAQVLADARRMCAQSGTHLSQDARVAQLFKLAHEEKQQAIERERQAEASRQRIEYERDQQRAAEIRAALAESQNNFGTEVEKFRIVVYWIRRDMAHCSEDQQHAAALAWLANPPWHQRKVTA